MFSIVLLFGACDALGSAPTAVPPTATATPITDIRFIPTAVPAGLPANPLQMVMLPVSSSLYIEPEVTVEPEIGEVVLPADSTQAELDLEEAILKYSSVTVDIIPAKSPADVLEALCNVTENVSAVWVDGVSFTAALAQNCGEPIYIAQKRINNRLQNGEAGVVILNRNLGSTQLSALYTRTFCRFAVDDFYSWLLPLMVFRANNIDPTNFGEFVEYDNAEDLVNAVASGDCAGAGLSSLVYEDIVDGDEELSDDISVSFASPQIPFAVLMYPVEMQLGIRVSLTEGLKRLVDDDDDSELLRSFLGQDDLQVVELEDFADYDAFIDEVGLDFSILGN
jgi:ABC-type phosphate/phosphonate transport system substrate-binding protein